MELPVGILALALLTLGLPVVVEVRAEWANPFRLSIWIALWAGALGVRMGLPLRAFSLTVSGKSLFSVPLPRRRRKPMERPPRRPRPSPRRSLRRFTPYAKPGLRFLKVAPRYLRLRGGTVELAFGTGDPAITGKLFGWLCALRPMLPRIRIYARPVFLERSFCGRAGVRLWILPYRLVWEGARLGVDVLRIWWRERRSAKRQTV